MFRVIGFGKTCRGLSCVEKAGLSHNKVDVLLSFYELFNVERKAQDHCIKYRITLTACIWRNTKKCTTFKYWNIDYYMH